MTSSVSERLGRILAAELLVQLEQLFGRGDRVTAHFFHGVAVGALEAQPHRQSQEVAERQGGLVEGLAQGLADVARQRGLMAFEPVEGVIELCAGFVVVFGQALPDRVEGRLGDPRVWRDGADGGGTDPHE